MSGLIDLGVVAGKITEHDFARLIRMVIHDAMQIAGDYHGQPHRSAKFRASWPDEDIFAKANWRSFIEAVISDTYPALMHHERADVSEGDKQRMYKAILAWNLFAKASEVDNRLQMKEDTQQFRGDPYEVRRIAKDFGVHAHSRAKLMNSIFAKN